MDYPGGRVRPAAPIGVVVAALCLSAVLAVPRLAPPLATAKGAKLPRYTNPARFTSKRIVDGVSVGGVAIGMTKARAISVWGKPDGPCRRVAPYDPNDRRRGCSYGGFIQTRSGKQSTMPFAGFTVTPAGKVVGAHVSLVKYASSNPTVRRMYAMAAPRVLPMKTGKGIALRSTLATARRAYAIPIPVDVPYGQERELLSQVVVRRAGSCTVFTSRDSNFTYIESIAVDAAAFCPPEPDTNGDDKPG